MTRRSTVVLSHDERNLIVGLLRSDPPAGEAKMTALGLTDRQKIELRAAAEQGE